MRAATPGTVVTRVKVSMQEFVFVSVDADDEEGEPVLEFFNTAKSDLPVLWGFQFHPDQRKYRCAIPD